MTTYWNPHVLSALASGALNLANQSITLGLLFSNAVPTPTSPDNALTLMQAPGFQEVSGSGYTRVNVPCNTTVAGTPPVTTVVIGSNIALTLTAPTYVAAGIYYVPATLAGMTNPWLFISDDMFGNVVTTGAVVGTTATPKKLFSYTPHGTTVDISMGTLVQSPGPSTWESARIQHVWLYPQRVNYIPNPSGEDVGLFGWRSDGTLTRVAGGVDNPANNHLHTTGKLVESVAVPPFRRMRFSAYVKGTGTITLKLICLDASYATLGTVQGLTRPLYTDWARYNDILVPADDCVAVIPRIEASAAGLDVDMCLLEEGEALHNYFDGDSTQSLPGDFSWQGQQAQSYSCFYNNRYNTAARLFGGYFNGQVTLPSLVFDWVPTGTALYTHWDVLSVNDTKHPLKDWNPRIFVP